MSGAISTLCEICSNACGGCAWSRYRVQAPVHGWDAVRRPEDVGWTVLACPEFALEERYRLYYWQFLEDREQLRRCKSTAHPSPRVISKQDCRIMRRLHAKGWSDAQIALEIGAAEITVKRWRLRSGLPCNSKRLLDHRERLRLYRRGLSDAEIAGRVNVSCQAIRDWRRNVGLPPNL